MKQPSTTAHTCPALESVAEKSPSKNSSVTKSRIISAFLLAIFFLLTISACVTTPIDPMKRINEAWLADSQGELFRVVMMSDGYYVSQKNYQDKISRAEDTGGDQFFMERLRRYDIVSRETEGMIRIQLYPDSGRLMKVRFLQSTYITEIDKMITDDIQRWTFNFSGPVSPTSFSIRYRVVLRPRSNADQGEINQELEKKRRRR